MLITAAALAVTLAVQAASSSAASGLHVGDASLRWGLSDTASSGAYFGGCNFLSAGKAGDTGRSAVWTTSTPGPGYAVQAGDVRIEKPNSAGALAAPSWATKCTGPDGRTPLSTATSSKTVVEFSGGSGTVDPSAGTASISWTGSFTSVFYGGMSYWSATDPTLTVNPDGTGTLTATVSGYGASMDDPTRWVTLGARTATLATLTGVTVTPTGIGITPAYAGVTVTTGDGDTPQVRSGSGWGAWPQSFVDFQHLTGESSYWYSSGLNDGAKAALPLAVGYTLAPDDATTTAAAATTAPATTAPATTASRTTSPPASSPATGPATSAASGSTPSYHPAVTLDQKSVAAGGTITFTGRGFAPGEPVSVTLHSAPVTLTPLTADSSGTVSGEDIVPASVPAGSHELILTGRTSQASAQAALTVTAQATCTLSGGVKGGSLVWGFKKSFRAYVAGPSANTITASSGAQILAQDEAVPGDASSGTYLWPFTSSSAYTSASDFTVQYGGKVVLSYPAHFFTVSIANPKVVVAGNTGVLYADVSLTVTEPGSAPSVSAHSGEKLATISLAGTSPVSDSSGVTRTVHTAIADVDSFSFDGTAFYTEGEALDDATVLLSGCTGTAAPTGTGTGTGSDAPSAAADAGLDNDSALIPTAQFRPDGAAGSAVGGLASTGADVAVPALTGLVAVLLGSLLLLVGLARRRHDPTKGTHR